MQANQNNNTDMNTTAKVIIAILTTIILALFFQLTYMHDLLMVTRQEKETEVMTYRKIIGDLSNSLEDSDRLYLKEVQGHGFYRTDYSDYGDSYSSIPEPLSSLPERSVGD